MVELNDYNNFKGKKSALVYKPRQIKMCDKIHFTVNN